MCTCVQKAQYTASLIAEHTTPLLRAIHFQRVAPSGGAQQQSLRSFETII
jgi:hypothetical protein